MVHICNRVLFNGSSYFGPRPGSLFGKVFLANSVSRFLHSRNIAAVRRVSFGVPKVRCVLCSDRTALLEWTPLTGTLSLTGSGPAAKRLLTACQITKLRASPVAPLVFGNGGEFTHPFAGFPSPKRPQDTAKRKC